MTTPPEPGENRRSPSLLGLHVLTLSCLAFAHPLLDLLGRSAEFLVIRRLGAIEVFALTGALLLVVPLPILVVALVSERFGRTPGRVVNGMIIAALFALIVLRMVSATGLAGGVVAVVVAILAGSGAGIAYQRSAPVRSFVTWLSPALLVVPLFFFLQADVRRAIFASDEGQVLASTGARSPIIFLVFDELSLVSLVDGDGLVDAERYPNFASLAAGATWYRNAYTVADTTNVALPAMLTSRFPGPGELPLLADHPRNIFSLFGGDYRIRAEEPITRLCPPRINEYQRETPPPAERAARLGSDLGVVWLHLVLPASYRERLPSISNTWEGFAETGPAGSRQAGPKVPSNSDEFFVLAVDELSRGDRVERFREFVSSIDPEDDQVLYFTHVLLPHVPWEYLPSGQVYSGDRGRIPGLVEDLWMDEPEPVRMAGVRYLMQVELVDLLVGELIETLERQGMYDKSLLVLVADHGASFRAGDRRRAYSSTNAAEILPVPLWIKAPGQTEGEVVDATVSVLDILPTMLDILDIEVPWELEGRSTRSLQPESQREFRVSTKYDGELAISVDDLEARKLEVAHGLAESIGPPSDLYRQSRGAPHPELLGVPISTLQVRNGRLWSLMSDPGTYKDYDPDAAVLPLLVEGAVKPDRVDCCDMAFAVGGRIVATARSYPVGDGRHAFNVIVPEHALQSGFNDVEILRVLDADPSTGGGPIVERTVDRQHRSYAISSREDGSGALIGDGVEYRLGRRLDGWVEGVEVEGDWVRIHGWATDPAKKGLASEVVLFYRDRYLVSGATWLSMGHVVEAFDEPGYMFSGFSFDVPLSDVPDVARHGVRVLAYSDDGHATELGALFLSLEDASGSDRLLFSNGKTYPLDPAAIDGWVEVVRPQEEGVLIGGWAANLEKLEPAVEIVVYHKGRYVTRAAPTGERPDLIPGHDGTLRCGFGIFFDVKPEAARHAIASGDARFFAISRDGRATELKIIADR
jgi:hypothetical protein